MVNPLQLALIGCGRQGKSAFVPAVNATEDAELAAFVDIDPQAAHTAAGSSGNIFADVESLANSGAAQAAIVAVPHPDLAGVALQCLEAGLHVLVENPCGRNRTEAQQLVEVAAERNLVMMPGYCLRFHETRTRLRDFLWRGLAGSITGLVATKGSPPYGGWLANPDAGGGPLLYVGSHVVDQVLWLHSAQVKHVQAQMTEHPETGAGNWVSAIITFVDGVHTTIHITQAAGVHIDVLEVIGSGGRVRSDLQAASITVESTESRELESPATLHVGSETPNSMYVREVTSFVGAIRGNGKPTVAGADAVRTLAVLDAIHEATTTGLAVGVNDPWDGTTPHASLDTHLARLRVQFTYPADKIQSPLVHELSRRFQLKFDIRRADVDAGIGWIQLMLEGPRAEIDAAMHWAEQQGIRADPVEGDVISG